MLFKRIKAITMAVALSIPMVQMPVYAEENQDFFKDTSDETVEVLEEADTSANQTGGEAIFLSGTNFNAKIKVIAGNSGANFSTSDNSIKEIVWADSEDIPEETKNSENTVSSSTSSVPIYAWFEDGVLSIGSEADTMELGAQANFMFYRLKGLESFSFPASVDTSKTESLVNMFAGCSKLTSLDLSNMDTQDASNMNDMFSGDSVLSEITLGKSWKFATATGIPKKNWQSSATGEVWSYAALENLYAPADAATFSVTDADADVKPDEELFEGDSLGINNMFPTDDPTNRFTGFCINDEDQDPYGYYRKVEVTSDNVNWENWFHTDDYGYEPIGKNMREALITLLIEGDKALQDGALDYDTLQDDIWHFTSHYSDTSWDGSFWADKSYDKIENADNFKLYIYESLEGKQNVISIEGVEIPQPVQVVLRKVDSNGDHLSGAKIQITGTMYAADGSTSAVYGPVKYNSEDLNSTTLNLYPGDYVMSELEVPEGFRAAEDVEFTVNADGTITSDALTNGRIVMVDENIVTTDVEISKQDIAGNEIAGARLTVTDSEGNTVDTWTSAEGESHIIEGITDGEFTLTELTSPDGYTKAESIVFTVTKDGKVTVNGRTVDQIVMVDGYTPANVMISKQDIAGEEIEGAVLTVTDADGKIIETWTSEAGKSHEIKGLTPGVFHLTERQVPTGYEKAESIEFTVLPGGSVQVDGKDTGKVVMVDEYTPYPVTFRKVEITKSVESLIPGAKLILQDEDGKTIEAWTTDSNAKVISLNPGTYILSEQEAPSGFDIADPIKFHMEVGGKIILEGDTRALDSATITMVDPVSDGTKEVKILKTGMDDKALSGASLRVYHTESSKEVIDKQWTSGSSAETLKLVPGTYVLEELSSPTGYVIADKIEFTVQPSGRILVGTQFVDQITMKDEPTLVGFQKVDADSNERISGARLQVLSKNGDVVEEWTSSEHIHQIRGKLAAGEEYTLHEASAPDNYEVADDVKFTVNKDSSELSVVMKDKAIPEEEVEYGTIQVFKTVEGNGADTTKKFGFIIALMDDDNEPFTGSLAYEMSDGSTGNLKFNNNGRAGFELSHGQYILFKNVEAGMYYTITELDYSAEGYTSSVEDRSAQINKGENIIHFVNTYGTVSATGTSTSGTSGSSGGTSSASGTVTTSRDTGDASHLWMWGAALAVGLVAIGGFFALKLKKRR